MLPRRLVLFFVLAAFAAGSACSVGDLDLAGRTCPCTTGYTCDVATSTCVRGALTPPPPPDSGPQPPFDAGVDAPPPAFTAKLTMTWATAQAMRLDWEVTGDPALFREYKLVAAPTREAVDEPSSATQTYDRVTNPELGKYSGRDTGTTGHGWTVADRLAPNAPVFARFKVYDTKGGTGASDILEVHTTTNLATEIPFLNKATVSLATLDPGDTESSTDCALGPGECFRFTNKCSDAAATACDNTFGVRNLAIDMKPVVADPKRFDAAFIEVALRSTAPATSDDAPFNDVTLVFGDAACPLSDLVECRFRWQLGWSFRPASDWRVIQIPLRELRLEVPAGAMSRPITPDDITKNQSKLRAVTLRSHLTKGAVVSFDRGSIHY